MHDHADADQFTTINDVVIAGRCIGGNQSHDRC